MVAAFILVDLQRIRAFLRSLVPEQYQRDYDRIVGGIDRGLSGVIRGQLVICLINGVLTYIGLLALQGEVPAAAGRHRRDDEPGPDLRLDPVVGPHRRHRAGLVGHVRSQAGGLRAGLDHRHPPGRGELPQPEDHGRRGQDSPGAGGVRADRRRAQLRPGRRAVRGAGGVDHPDDLRLLPSPAAASPRRSEAARRLVRRSAARATIRAPRRAGRGRRRTIRAERSGTSCQPGRDRDVSVRLDDDRAQRLVRDAPAAAPASLRSLAAWQTGQSEMPSTCRYRIG